MSVLPTYELTISLSLPILLSMPFTFLFHSISSYYSFPFKCYLILFLHILPSYFLPSLLFLSSYSSFLPFNFKSHSTFSYPSFFPFYRPISIYLSLTFFTIKFTTSFSRSFLTYHLPSPPILPFPILLPTFYLAIQFYPYLSSHPSSFRFTLLSNSTSFFLLILPLTF